MQLETALKIVGWVFTGLPLIAFVSISIFILKGVAGDDSLIMALILLGITMFVIGVICLLLVYLSGLFDASTFGYMSLIG